MRRTLSLFCLPALAFAAGSLGVGYPDGTQVTIQTASTGLNIQEIIYNNAVNVADTGSVWHRVVSDKQGKVLFAYDLEAHRGSAPGTFFIRIRPVDPAYANTLRAPVPTVSAIREFNAVKAGQSVALDILSFPATGDMIYDVLQPSAATGSVAPQGEEFAFIEISVSLNGHPLKELAGSGLTGAGAMLYVPGRGAYFLSLEAKPGFQQVGHAEKNKLWFDLDYDHIEINSKTRVLSKSDSRLIWVKHDVTFRSPSNRRSDALSDLDKKINEVKTEIVSLQKQYRDDYPLIKQLKKEIDTLMFQKAHIVVDWSEAPGDVPFMGTADNVDWLMPKKD